MAVRPQSTAPRRSAALGGGPPSFLRPGEFWIDTRPNAVAVYVGDGLGRPQALGGGQSLPPGAGGSAAIGANPPVAPLDGQLWFDTAAATLKVFDALAVAWQAAFDDAALLAHDGSRAVTGPMDFASHDILNAALDAGSF